jgi:hypothetical protein
MTTSGDFHMALDTKPCGEPVRSYNEQRTWCSSVSPSRILFECCNQRRKVVG